MKYYPPPNLAVRSRAERMSVEEVLRTGIQLASAVETAHRAGIIHRDIKPANVLVSQYGQPGLTDFGIAGRGGHAEDVDEDVGVSVPWSPPEVLYGQSNGDARSDVYSLAATLWHLLVGRSPFEQPGGDNSAYALMPRIRAVPVPPTGRADVPVVARAAARPRDGQGPGVAPADRARARARPAGGRAGAAPAAHPGGRARRAGSHGARRGLGGAARARPRPHQRARPRLARRTGARRARRRAASPTTVDDGPPTISGGLILGVVGVLVLGLVGALVWALGRDDTPQAQPSASVRSQTAAPTRAVDYPEQPALDARPGADEVTFTWNYVGAEEGDFFQLRVADSEAAVVDESVTNVQGRPRQTVKAEGRRAGLCPGRGVAQVGRALAALGDPLPDRRLTGIHRYQGGQTHGSHRRVLRRGVRGGR